MSNSGEGGELSIKPDTLATTLSSQTVDENITKISSSEDMSNTNTSNELDTEKSTAINTNKSASQLATSLDSSSFPPVANPEKNTELKQSSEITLESARDSESFALEPDSMNSSKNMETQSKQENTPTIDKSNNTEEATKDNEYNSDTPNNSFEPMKFKKPKEAHSDIENEATTTSVSSNDNDVNDSKQKIAEETNASSEKSNPSAQNNLPLESESSINSENKKHDDENMGASETDEKADSSKSQESKKDNNVATKSEPNPSTETNKKDIGDNSESKTPSENMDKEKKSASSGDPKNAADSSKSFISQHKHSKHSSADNVNATSSKDRQISQDSFLTNSTERDTAYYTNITDGRTGLNCVDSTGLIRAHARQNFEIGIGIGSGISGLGSAIGTGTTTANRETASFLETLTEEEKRTRTRHLPDVEGFRRLHKSEIKSDLKVARSHHSFQPELFSKQASKLDKKGEFSSLDSNKSLASTRPLIDIIPDDEEYYQADSHVSKIPNPFIAPEGISKSARQTSIGGSISSGGEGEESLSSGIGLKQQLSRSSLSPENGLLSLKSPKIVESITAFNPPRPPESNGPKKKNRILRWERNPHEVEIDLDNYKKTVERTQEELHHAEKERERVEVLGFTFRDHFMNQLRLIREESVVVNREFQSLQKECMKLANVFASESESDSDKCENILEILSLLADEKALVQSEKEKDFSSLISKHISENVSGVGGVALGSDEFFSQMLKNKNTFPHTSDDTAPIASGWILPGNDVKTAYGNGTVVDVYGVSFLDTAYSAAPEVGASSAKTSLKKNHRHKMKKSQYVTQKNSGFGKNFADASTSEQTSGTSSSKKNILSRILPPRVCVRLPFGIAYFAPNQVSVVDTPATFSDHELVSRWKSMIDTAYLMNDCVDTDAMKNKYMCDGPRRRSGKMKSKHVSQDEENEDMDIDGHESGKQLEYEQSLSTEQDDSFINGNKRVVPFGANMITASGWGASALTKIPLHDLEDAIHPVLFKGYGILGKVRNCEKLLCYQNFVLSLSHVFFSLASYLYH